jgi:hypothetical protein
MTARIAPASAKSTRPIAAHRRRLGVAAIVLAPAIMFFSQCALADESGVSFWLPGLYGSLSAVPQAAPGWSFVTFNYYDRVSAGSDVATAREVQIGRFTPTATVNLSANLNVNLDLQWVQPNYAFATPVLGGQLMVSMGMFIAWEEANLAGTLMATVPPFTLIRSDNISSPLTGFGDLYPVATLRWHNGVDNWMTYMTGAIPVGAYDSMRLANLGSGHGAIDGGGGYTYLNPATGHEWSGVGGFTYNTKNPDTGVQSGIDFHFDWGASQFLSKQLFVGAVGYAFQQISNDTGPIPIQNGFKSRVLGVGPQIGYLFPVGNAQGYLNLKAYGEFDAANRPSGWNAWLTFSISPAAPESTVAPTKHLVTK